MPYECDSEGQWWYVARNYRSRAYPSECMSCGKTFYARRSDAIRFCSKQCGIRRERHPLWKGGRITVKGYIHVLGEVGDPIAESMRDRRGYVAEHRLVMATALGRPLQRNEHVHHLNGDKSDNRVENLELLNRPHGPGVVLRCADCGSRNVHAVTLG
jgi:hypothetical protein